MERQEADGDRREGRQQSKVKGLRRAWGTEQGEGEMRTGKQVKGNETSFFII